MSGFPDFVNKYEIKRVFSKYGTIHKIKISPEQHVAYLDMPYKLQATTAIKELDGSKIVGRTINVEEID